MKLRLVFVTGTRAEYGLLRPVLKKAFADPEVDCRLLVTGAHLRADFGSTVDEIEKDGFPIEERIDILRFGTTREGVAQSVGLAIRLFSAWFSAHPTDACILLGDRYEMFAAASAAALTGVPVVHISGGDVTWGAQDDWFRHCITKMAALHFPYCECYRERIIRMGEQPDRVFNVGALGAENIHSLQLLSREELCGRFGFDFHRRYLLVTYHPETLSQVPPADQLARLLQALDAFPQLALCLTKANADAGGVEINAALEKYARDRKDARVFASMGVVGYLSAMKYCAAVVGNSSSGVVETPEFGVPCVNIGQRQGGRIQCKNVLNCACEAGAIRLAIEKALTPAFQSMASRTKSPFYRPDTSSEILRITKEFAASGRLLEPKHFYDAGPLAGGAGSTLTPDT